MSFSRTAALTALVVTIPVAAAADEDPSTGHVISDGLARDRALISSLIGPSPVAERAARRSRERRAKRLATRGRQATFAAFRTSQKGPFDGMILREAEKHGLDPFLFKGLLANESRLDPSLTGKRIYAKVKGRRRAVGGGARGIAQFTHSGVDAVNEARQARQFRGERVRAFERKEVWDPETAIAASAELLSTFMYRYGRDGGVTAYNTGPGGGRMVQKYGFYRARRSGKLSRHGHIRLQGHRFLVNVLRHTNGFRRAAGLKPLPGPGRRRAVDPSIGRRIKSRKGKRPTS